MRDATRDAAGVYIEAGEDARPDRRFDLDQIAAAFAVAPKRVRAALRGELGLGPEATVDSRAAQALAESLLGDLPLDQREAALMRLGAFTPRADADWGFGSGPPAEESDRQAGRVAAPDAEQDATRGDHGPRDATQ